MVTGLGRRLLSRAGVGRAGRTRPALVDERPPALRWTIKNPATGGRWGDRWGDTYFASCLAAALERLGQQVIVQRRNEWDSTEVESDVVLVLRGLTAYRPEPGPVNLIWLISHPDEFSAAEAASYDAAFAASIPWSTEVSRRWGVPIEPLLQATDPHLFSPDAAIPDSGEDVLFVGNSRKVLRPMIAAALAEDVDVAVFGTQWGDLIPARHLKAEWLPHDQLAAAYRSAGIVISDHWEDMRAAGFIANRVFDAVASGARVVSDDVDGLAELFGVSVQVVREPGDLRRLCDPVGRDTRFGDDADRRRSAARIATEHTFDVRASRLLQVAVERRSRRTV